MRFCRSPVEIKGDGKVESIVVGRNELYTDESGQIRARDTGEREEIECGLVLRSIGYKGTGLEGIPFDAARGLIPNESGRVVDPETGEQVPGHYAVGWIKRGPSGVIGTNKKDALETVNTIFDDLADGRSSRALSAPAHARTRSRGRGGCCSDSGAIGRAGWRPRHLYRLAGDRRRRTAGRRAARAPAGQVLSRPRDDRGGAIGRGILMAADLAELARMIEEALPGAEVEMIDEGGGDHLRAVVAAPQFDGLTRIDQHRLVRAAVKPRFDDGAIHALSIQTSLPG